MYTYIHLTYGLAQMKRSRKQIIVMINSVAMVSFLPIISIITSVTNKPAKFEYIIILLCTCTCKPKHRTPNKQYTMGTFIIHVIYIRL